MTPLAKLKTSLLLAAGAMAALPSVSFAQEEEESEDDIIVLSSFVVFEDEDTGYAAANTLAGTRIKSPLKDVGSAISVLTEELFEDTGATNAETILGYATSMEVHGVHGNFADGPGENHNGRFEQDTQRLEPQSAQRVRGLAKASLTRGFFLTDIPFDSYNSGRVDISRGANSLLFGIGEPGGIINNSVSKASVDRGNEGEIGIRVGERGSYRATFDYNGVFLKERLAARVALLREDTQYQQKPAFEIVKRAHIALEAVLLKNEKSSILGRSLFRGNFEFGRINGAPPLLIPPHDGFSSFFEPPDIATLQSVPGVVVPGYYSSGNGLAGDGQTERNRSHPEFGYDQWHPKQTFDNRLGVTGGNVPAVVERNYHRLSVKFDYSSVGAIPFGTHNGTDYFAGHGSATNITGIIAPQLDDNLVPVLDENGNMIQGSFDDVTSTGPAFGNVLICAKNCGTDDASFRYQGYGLGVDGLIYPVMNSNLDYIYSGSFFMGNRNDQRIPNFTTPVILDKRVWDNENEMLQGLTQERHMSFDVRNFSFEQPLFNFDGGIELVYDFQHYSQRTLIPFSEQETIGDSGNGDVVIDLNEYVAGGDGGFIPNPNLGRPLVKGDLFPDEGFRVIDRESYRFTGFYKLDFAKFGEGGIWKVLGNHTLTGFFNRQRVDTFNFFRRSRYVFPPSMDCNDRDYQGCAIPILFTHPTVYEVYLGPDVRQFSDPSQVQLNRITATLPRGDGTALDSFGGPALHWNRDSPPPTTR